MSGQREIMVSGSLQRHQVREYVRLRGIQWIEESGPAQTKFTFPEATDEQWGQIQEWVKKVTG